MLDPLTALSLAGTVVQFVDFGSKIVSKGYRLHESGDGTLVENAFSEKLTTDLARMCRDIKQSLSSQAAPGANGIAGQELLKLCSGSLEVAEQLLERFESLKVKGSKHRKWKSARQALKSVCSKQEIEAMEKRLARYREMIEMEMMVAFR
jgi:hypothetical protein